MDRQCHRGRDWRPFLVLANSPRAHVSHTILPVSFPSPTLSELARCQEQHDADMQAAGARKIYYLLSQLSVFEQEEDDSDKEDGGDDEDPAAISNAARLLKLFDAGHVAAKCNRCSTWVKTSIPERTPLTSAGHFSGLESHQGGTKCLFSRAYIRATTAPPDPQTVRTTVPADDMDVDEDVFPFQRSLSAPPEEIRPLTPEPEEIRPPAPDPASTRASSCPGVLVDWEIEAGPLGRTFPWHRVIHCGASDLQTESFRIEIDSAEVTRAFSLKCAGSTNTAPETNVSRKFAVGVLLFLRYLLQRRMGRRMRTIRPTGDAGVGGGVRGRHGRGANSRHEDANHTAAGAQRTSQNGSVRAKMAARN
ncbi:hypothetical protein C8R47DRAFT_1084624 [Mycena vitilis]|nr:hypothetical protein C8R47DRAFT_1084624 [Mycena vitilis]